MVYCECLYFLWKTKRRRKGREWDSNGISRRSAPRYSWKNALAVCSFLWFDYTKSIFIQRAYVLLGVFSPTSLSQKQKTPVKDVFCFWRREWDSNPRDVAVKRFSRSLPKNTVSAQFGAVQAKTIPENPYFTRLFGTVWNRSEPKRIDRNRYSPLVF